MSPHNEETHSMTSTEHTIEVHDESSIGKKVGEGIQYAISITYTAAYAHMII